MPDLTASLIGTAVLAVPAYVVLWLALRRQPPAIFRFGLALLAVGLGYLIATGATADVGQRVMAVWAGASVPNAAPAIPTR